MTEPISKGDLVKIIKDVSDIHAYFNIGDICRVYRVEKRTLFTLYLENIITHHHYWVHLRHVKRLAPTSELNSVLKI